MSSFASRLRLMGRGEDQVHEAVDPPRLLGLDPFRRVEVLHLAGEVDLVVAVVELRDLGRPGLACEQAPPRRLDVVCRAAKPRPFP